MTVVVPGRAEPASLPVGYSPFTALKLESGWWKRPGIPSVTVRRCLPPSHRWQ
ncbi:hypothetical protein ACLB1Q_35630 [Escherichia coli]